VGITLKLIFIHGAGGSKDVWYYQLRYFAEADAVNLPGHPEGEPCTSVDSYVEWLRTYLLNSGHSDVVLAGHSLGGAICQLYALRHPGDLRGLIIIGSGARLRVAGESLEILEQAKGSVDILKEYIDQSWQLVAPELREVVQRNVVANGAAVFLNDLLCCDRFDIMKRVREIAVPTLVLCGSKDITTPPKHSRYLVDNIKGAREVIIDGGTHMVFAEKPSEVNEAIEHFLDSL